MPDPWGQLWLRLDAIDAQLAAIRAKTDTIGALEVTVRSPVAELGTVTLYAADDYLAAHGRSIDVLVAADDVPDLGGATVRFKCERATWVATSCTRSGPDWRIVFEPRKEQTGNLMLLPRQKYEVEATLADGSVITLVLGILVVVEDIPAVV